MAGASIASAGPRVMSEGVEGGERERERQRDREIY
jgi:hypothetical protein